MKKEVKIGIIGIVALGLLFFGINYLKGVSMLKSSTSYYVEYTDINGLATSSPVFASGYKVGIVRGIEYNHANPGHVVVEVELDKGMRIPKGSKGELVTEMLGTVKMNLKLNLESKEYNQPGDTLPGYVNNGLMGIAETTMPKVEALLPKMDSILHSLNQLLASPALTATLNNAEKLTNNLDITTRHLNHMMQNDLPKLTNRLTTITDNFATISDNLKGIDYANTMQKVDSTLYQVQMLTSKLNSKDNTVGLLFNDPTLYNNLSATTANAASLLEDLKAHPKRYVHFSLFGRKEKTEDKAK
ncbi:MAG: MCE family protein [Bacteroidaceae bacterium]|nr:MCE family protein [Bacteroidaceae bacterium]